MKRTTSSVKLYISKSKNPRAGRGVFAGQDIPRGETIERCLFLEIPGYELENLENSVLTNYVYFFGKHKERILLALGFGSLYNHSYSPNAKYKIFPKEKVIEFLAIEDIVKNKEILVNYLRGNGTNLPLWFDV